LVDWNVLGESHYTRYICHILSLTQSDPLIFFFFAELAGVCVLGDC